MAQVSSPKKAALNTTTQVKPFIKPQSNKSKAKPSIRDVASADTTISNKGQQLKPNLPPKVAKAPIAKAPIAKAPIAKAPIAKAKPILKTESKEEIIDYKSLGMTKKTQGTTKDGKNFPIIKLGESLKLPPCPKLPPEPNPIPQTVENTKLIESIHYMLINKFMEKSKSTIKFDTVKEAEDTAKEDIISAIIDKTNQLKQDKSELQKKGRDLSIEGLKLLQIPLKTKIWKASVAKKDLETIYKLFSEIDKVVTPMKAIQLKKDDNHEKYLTAREKWLISQKEIAKKTHKKTIGIPKEKTTPKVVTKQTIKKPATKTTKKPIAPAKRSLQKLHQLKH